MVSEDEARQNHLLKAMPPSALARWLAHLTPVDLPLGRALYEAGSRQSHIYFPVTGIVSLRTKLADGPSAEVAVVGDDGAVGVALLTGGGSMAGEAIVRGTGYGYAVSEAFVSGQFGHVIPVTDVLLRYTQALISQMAQTVVCNRHHGIDARLCRWLLMTLDRTRGNSLVATQGLIATALGVRREGVNEAALRLQAADMICCTRGHVLVLNRALLEEACCECYAVVKREHARLLPR